MIVNLTDVACKATIDLVINNDDDRCFGATEVIRHLRAKRLIFKNMTLSSFSKSASGNAPSKSLNQRLRYLSDDRQKVTFENGSMKWLLLVKAFRVDVEEGCIDQEVELY